MNLLIKPRRRKAKVPWEITLSGPNRGFSLRNLRNERRRQAPQSQKEVTLGGRRCVKVCITAPLRMYRRRSPGSPWKPRRKAKWREFSVFR